MRKPASFLDDFSLSKEDEDFNYVDPLCCPDDPLDEVLRYIPTLDDKILEALGIDCSSSPSVGEDEDLAVGSLKSTSAAGNSCSETSAASSSYRSVSSASASSWESESSDNPASSFQYWHVPTKPRRQAVNVRKRPWSHSFLPFPSAPVPAAAVHDTHGISMANAGGVGEFSHGPQGNVCKLRKPSPGDDDGGNFSKLGYNGSAGKLGSGNGSGSGSEAGRRRSAGRQRGGHEGTRCSHCHATETPQWRAGPDGPGTLCNACGIRYRMGRDKLVPEYRPSTSPFFRNGEHSNRHSKVEKLREKKVQALKVSPGALTPTGSGGIVDSSVL